MDRKILNSFISVALCLLMGVPLQAQNRNTPGQPSNIAGTSKAPKDSKDSKKKDAEVTFPLYNGVSVGVDLFGIGNKVFGGDFVSSEVSIDVNLKNRFFPVVEIGYGGTDSWSDKGTHYRTNAPYFRIGVDYNALYKKTFKHCLLVGVRYGMSSFGYDVNELSIDDPIYGGSVGNPNQEDNIWGGSVPFNHQGMKGSMQWFEFCVGLRAHIWKNLYMGWTMRMKYRLSSKTDTYGDPWYVPGFGEYASNTMGVTYTITYKLPF